jgi:hypothetical protein
MQKVQISLPRVPQYERYVGKKARGWLEKKREVGWKCVRSAGKDREVHWKVLERLNGTDREVEWKKARGWLEKNQLYLADSEAVAKTASSLFALQLCIFSTILDNNKPQGPCIACVAKI